MTGIDLRHKKIDHYRRVINDAIARGDIRIMVVDVKSAQSIQVKGTNLFGRLDQRQQRLE